MYSTIDLDDVEEREIDGLEPRLKAIGYELRPEEMRPSVWVYGPGDANNDHRHREQEEFYVVLDGSGTMTVDGDEIDLSPGTCVVVPPETWRQITADEELTVLAVGAPNVANDGIRRDEV